MSEEKPIKRYLSTRYYGWNENTKIDWMVHDVLFTDGTTGTVWTGTDYSNPGFPLQTDIRYTPPVITR